VTVVYDTMSVFEATFGVTMSGQTSYFGLLFVADPWNGCSCTTSTGANPNNLPPTSSDDALTVTSGVPTALSSTDFGNYADADGNPFDSVRVTSLPTSGALERFVGAVRSPLATAALFERDPRALEILLGIFSASPYLAELVIADPEAWEEVRIGRGRPRRRRSRRLRLSRHLGLGRGGQQRGQGQADRTG
jgi:hypothetical protein